MGRRRRYERIEMYVIEGLSENSEVLISRSGELTISSRPVRLLPDMSERRSLRIVDRRSGLITSSSSMKRITYG